MGGEGEPEVIAVRGGDEKVAVGVNSVLNGIPVPMSQ
jgi:hypothetical protein